MKSLLKIAILPVILLFAVSIWAETPEKLQTLCEKGDTDACVMLGDSFFKGAGVKQDYSRALLFYSKACESGSAAACVNLGKMYDEGLGVTQSLRKAVLLYTKACDAGDAMGCDSIRVLYDIGKNVAFESHTRECNTGNSDACVYLGFLVRYDNTIGMNQKKVPEALDYYTNECNSGEASGCYFLGVMYENGNGVKKDIKKSDELFKKSCKMGYKRGCDK